MLHMATVHCGPLAFEAAHYVTRGKRKFVMIVDLVQVVGSIVKQYLVRSVD